VDVRKASWVVAFPVWQSFRWAIVLSVIFLACPLFLPAQENQAPDPIAPSGLAADNLNRVAASATQVEELLRKEPGLLVELKRWVAKEATDRGQILDDTELTDQAIFERLTRDLEFRSVATRLLQRYGYLMPNLNPDSEAARERELLFSERTRRMTRAEAGEDNVLEENGSERKLKRAEVCGSTSDRECAEPRQQRERDTGGSYPQSPVPERSPSNLRDQMVARQARENSNEEPDISARQRVQTIADPDSGAIPPSNRRKNEPSSFATAATSLGDGSPAHAPDLAATEMPAEVFSDRKHIPRSRPAGNEEKEEVPGRPRLLAKANPYADIPSLYDMYVQASARRTVLERFGLDIFRSGTPDSGSYPMDLPVGPDYVVGPGDGLAIDLWGGVAQRLYRTVDREGRLSLPEVGPILVSGRTMAEVQQAVQHVLRTQYRDVSADISLSRLRTVRVYVVGDVQHPGAYDISSLSTPLNALFAAGGCTGEGSLRSLKHFRGKQLIEEIDAYDLLLRGVRSELKRLENGDTLLVSPLGPQITVEGMVRRPAIYELHEEKNLAEVLELAGGILPTAALRHIEVQRVEAHQKRTMLSLDISETADAAALAKQFETFAVQGGDVVHIFPIAPYNQNAVYLQGHVIRPGRYSFQPGMKLTDVVSSQADLLPEPAGKYAEIIRLNPPDYRPSVESFNLADALANPAAAPVLQPLDTVRIFSRYDFEDPPSVWVGGEVRHSGAYRTSGEAHLRDAIYLAGNVTADAFLDTAELIRNSPDGSLKILSINLKNALTGDPLDNVILQPRDRIVVHRNPAKVDPPSVFVKGEVAKPGRYPLTSNLRVEDLLRLAGGLKRSAFTESADLTRYSLNTPQEKIGEHREVSIAAAFAGNPSDDLLLRDGDILTIRQLPGWNDIGASITVKGEMDHPGTYGIRPGERLSSVLKRAGGFRPTAYPAAAVLERVEVRELQEKNRQELIQRIEQEGSSIKVSFTETAKDQADLQQAALQQRQRVLEGLRKMPVGGRMVIKIRANLAEFENSPDDIEVRAGDSVYIPKRPGFVMVIGQVYNSNAITFEPRKSARWYLQHAGGATHQADSNAIFIIRANGAVVSGKGNLWSGGALSAQVGPGDTIVVPEKAIGGGTFWKNLLAISQVASSASLAALVATR
jgi:polysaccharide export outer membrane protein